jgi:hypothetical protein
MNIEKTNWSSNGNRLSIGVPFSKVNKENRTVSGFATLNNVDQTGDVVTAEASLKAFENFRGNIREMHQPIAVGKILSFKSETFFDPISKSFYDGIWVSTYISKGAQATWEKVLDGTLSGFSIGGRINDADTEVNKSNGESVRFIKDYDLVELSLVDSPANELCNVLSIEKVNGQLVFKGLAAETLAANVFFCSSDNIVVSETVESRDCTACGNSMEIIGWVENNEVNKADAVRYVYEQHINKISSSANELENNTEVNKGGTTMSEETTMTEETTVDAPVAEAVAEAPVAEAPAAEEAPAVAEESAPAEDSVAADTAGEPAAEAASEELDFAKMLGDLKGFLSDTLSKAAETNAAQVAEVKNTVESFSKSVEARIVDLAEQHNNLSETVKGIRETIGSVEKRIDAVEGETAIKKSADLGGSTEFVKKSKWSGAFLGSVNDILN